MKKTIITTFILGAFLIGGCNINNNNSQSESSSTRPSSITYEVTKEQYNQVCCYEAYVPRITSLNFKVTYVKACDDSIIQNFTCFDNGKIMSTTSYGHFYCDFKEETYNPSQKTWTYDRYFENDGIWSKQTFENETMPDDICLPDIGFFISYEEMKFNPKTNWYEQIAEDKVFNDYYHFSETIVGFVNGRIHRLSYKYSSSFEPEKVFQNNMNITDYTLTVVDLPSIITE